ncbi:unnamed protein product [Anisakis simplex]|uniref:DDE_Tnp_1_7 domain-containing protein n=1 Tax=Anisakis simplex TaxID=6269 RepID=A0A0M3JYE4_ANISI|nr:unnamed protein product [Anisakis simplex]
MKHPTAGGTVGCADTTTTHRHGPIAWIGTVDHSGGMDSIVNSPTSRVSFEELLSDHQNNLTVFNSYLNTMFVRYERKQDRHSASFKMVIELVVMIEDTIGGKVERYRWKDGISLT